MTEYVATIYMPGHMQINENVSTFDTSREAWEYLADERDRAIDLTWQEGDKQDDDASAQLLARASAEDWGVGTVHGSIPGYNGDNDPGLTYSVEIVEEN